MELVVILCLLGYTFAVEESCTCSEQLHSVNETLIKLVSETDIDGDGEITLTEFRNELLRRFDNNSDDVVAKAEFIHIWSSTYGDCTNLATTVFENLDLLPNGKLDAIDLLFHMDDLDYNSDDVVSVVEFTNFFHAQHPCG